MDDYFSLVFPGLHVLDSYVSENHFAFRVASRHSGNYCPSCGLWTQRVHSDYYRTIQDIPLSGVPVLLRLHSRKIFCDNPDCSQSIITERFDGLLSRSQQKTARLNEWLTRIAFELGGNPGRNCSRPEVGHCRRPRYDARAYSRSSHSRTKKHGGTSCHRDG